MKNITSEKNKYEESKYGQISDPLLLTNIEDVDPFNTRGKN